MINKIMIKQVQIVTKINCLIKYNLLIFKIFLQINYKTEILFNKNSIIKKYNFK